MNTLQGIPASPGIAIGPAFSFRRTALTFERTVVEDPSAEWARLQAAVAAAGGQLAEVYAKAKAESGAEQAEIFQAHLLMLEDPELLAAVRTAIEEQRLNAEAALSDVAGAYADTLAALDDEYLRARAADVRDVASRVLRILMGQDDAASGPQAPSIVLAQDLTPSDTVLLDKSLVLGFCTAEGGPTAHTAILARGLGLPAAVGAGPEVLDVSPGATVILDGAAGQLLVGPDEDTLAAYEGRRTALGRAWSLARRRAFEPAITRDGRRVEVAANIGNVGGAQAALTAGAEGVGLLRSEFLYLERTCLPDEDEQYGAYRAIVDAFGGLPVVLRTLDIGGDKDLPYLDLPRELNPFLGQRAIRLSLARPELFKPQLRAALRAAVDRNLKVMLPMVATVGEVRAAHAVLDECRRELLAEGLAVPERLEVGIMVEVPAAAVMADQLAREVGFFSIGTNDLSQYTLAADRTNAQVASLASGLQPSVLRLVREIVTAAHVQGKWVGLCGELAAEAAAIPILIGLGLDELSMSPPAIPLAKQLIRKLSLVEAQEVAQAALQLESAGAVRALVLERVPAVREMDGVMRC